MPIVIDGTSGITLPSGSSAVGTSDSQTLTNKTIGTVKSDTTSPPVVQNNGGTEVGTFCRSWVNFNGTGTVAIRASFNVTSITDNGVGDYTVNFTTAMSDANYATGASCSNAEGVNQPSVATDTFSTTSVRVYRLRESNGNKTYEDGSIMTVSVFR